MIRLPRVWSIQTCFLALLLAGSPSDLTSQEAAEPRFWLGAGLGGGLVAEGDQGAAHVSAQVAYQREVHLFTARGSVTAEILADGIWDLGLLYGRAASSPGRHLSISAGFGLVGTEVCPGAFSGPCEGKITVGFPLVATASLEGAGLVGLGLELSGNINPETPVLAAAVVARLGALR